MGCGELANRIVCVFDEMRFVSHRILPCYLLSRLPPDRRALELDVHKGVLASRLSVEPETLSRVIKSLGEQGVIDMHGSYVTVLDREALAEIADIQHTLELAPSSCAQAGMVGSQ